MDFMPKKVYFEKKSLDYPLGYKLYKLFISNNNVEVEILNSNRMKKSKEVNPVKFYSEGKNTLVIRVKKVGEFQTCKPSANYQLPLISGCAGMCEYCYLNTRFGNKPYITVYVNIEDILDKAKKYIEERKPEITVFEAAATSDPIPLEKYTHSLERVIEFMGKQDYARLRFVTKFTDIDSLLNIKHNNHTTIRFSINSSTIINKYEHRTASLNNRIEASKKIKDSRYSLGFIIGPVFIYENWKQEYLELLSVLQKYFEHEQISFEIISHRFTSRAKQQILDIFPNTTLPMKEEERKFKYGQFGYGKYIYKNEEIEDIKSFFNENIKRMFSRSTINYII